MLWGSFFSLDIRPDAFTTYLPTTLSFIVVGLVAFLGVYDAARDSAFSLNTSHWTYILFFLFYAPFVQFLVQQSASQSDLGLFDHYAIWVNCATLAWCGIYYFTYGSPNLAPRVGPRPAPKPRNEFVCTGWTYLLIVLVCVVSFAALYVLLGVQVLLVRSASAQALDAGADKSGLIIVNSVCRAIPVTMTGMLMLTRGKSKLLHWGTFAISSLFTLILNNPIAIARFWFGAILIGFCCLYLHIRKIRLTGLWIAVALTLGGLTVFPLLSATRYLTSADQLSNVELTSDWTDNVTSADFDGYSMVIATIEWTKREGATNGFQLIGNSLFWFPRSLWDDKPVGSGQMVAEYFDMVNTNMAEPMTAEAYVNFGWIGIPLYAFAIARLFAAVDRRYWSQSQKPTVSLLSLTYPFLTALTIYFLRGDYLSGVSSTLSLLGSAGLTIWLFRVTSRRVPTHS